MIGVGPAGRMLREEKVRGRRSTTTKGGRRSVRGSVVIRNDCYLLEGMLRLGAAQKIGSESSGGMCIRRTSENPTGVQ